MQPQTTPDLRRVIEALLFIGSSPVTQEKVARCVPKLTTELFDQVVNELAFAYQFQRRPYAVRRTPRGVVLALQHGQASDLISRSRSEKGAKLSRNVIETLAIVAYRQPITRAAIERLTNADAGSSLRQLVRRRLLEAREAPGSSDVEYVTTVRFLEMFGLETIEDLPTMEESV